MRQNEYRSSDDEQVHYWSPDWSLPAWFKQARSASDNEKQEGRQLSRGSEAMSNARKQIALDSGNPNADEKKGQHRFKRVLQAKHEAPGMECFGTTLMFLLQSYGLVDAEMSREEFERKYTNLYGQATETRPDGIDVFTHRYKQFKNSGDTERLGNKTMKVNGVKTVVPITDPGVAANFAIRGMESVPGVVRTTDDVKYYLEAFNELKKKDPQYKFGNKKFEVKDLSKIDQNRQILRGQLGANAVRAHLKGGDTIYAGISLTSDFFHPASSSTPFYLSMEHRVLLDEYVETIKVVFEEGENPELKNIPDASIDIYKADDAWDGKVFILERKIPTGKGVYIISSLGRMEVSAWWSMYSKGRKFRVYARDAFAASRKNTPN